MDNQTLDIIEEPNDIILKEHENANDESQNNI